MLDGTGARRRTAFLDPRAENTSLPEAASPDASRAYRLGVELDDHSWVVFTAPDRFWGIDDSTRQALAAPFVIFIILAIAAVAAYQLTRPMRHVTAALKRFGNDPKAAPIAVSGPRELRDAIRALNAMQAQIQTFVSDRTTMLAAISHDLRTPLTRIRLRGGFIDDDQQKGRLSRDVDEMQAMVDSALAFFRDDVHEEPPTNFDLPELLRTITDDSADQGTPVSYDGIDRLAYLGRPFACAVPSRI